MAPFDEGTQTLISFLAIGLAVLGVMAGTMSRVVGWLFVGFAAFLIWSSADGKAVAYALTNTVGTFAGTGPLWSAMAILLCSLSALAMLFLQFRREK